MSRVSFIHACFLKKSKLYLNYIVWTRGLVDLWTCGIIHKTLICNKLVLYAVAGGWTYLNCSFDGHWRLLKKDFDNAGHGSHHWRLQCCQQSHDSNSCHHILGCLKHLTSKPKERNTYIIMIRLPRIDMLEWFGCDMVGPTHVWPTYNSTINQWWFKTLKSIVCTLTYSNY